VIPTKINQLCALGYEAITGTAIVFSVSFIFVAILGNSPEGSTRYLLALIVALSLHLYYSWCWVRKGQSLAQRAWGLRLESGDNATLTISQSVLRLWLAALLNISMISILVLLFSKKNQFAHDICMKCKVVGNSHR
jgi:uncharacterized RDD family membrane protein YckC